MQVVGIAGSLRSKSNTLYFVETALKELEQEGIQTELISLRGKEISPCNGCYDCVKKHKGKCSLKGDDFDDVFECL